MMQSTDLKEIRDKALAGNEVSQAAIESAGRAIGSGIASLYALFDKFPIALIGRGTILFDLMEQPMRSALANIPGAGSSPTVDIACYLDDGALVREGCTIAALMEIDTRHAMGKIEQDAVA